MNDLPKIMGKNLREYLTEQFPATAGHIPLQQFYDAVGLGSSQVPDNNKLRERWVCEFPANPYYCGVVYDNLGRAKVWKESAERLVRAGANIYKGEIIHMIEVPE